MLQQTQVARVLERYGPWLERWPTPAALAAAPAADVLRAWSGLGYNRRALNLQNAARRVVELGGFPRDIAGLEQLPGVGPYTARAVACFAFGAEVTALDTNVRRVLERSLGTTDVAPPAGRAWDWNQALFDLGAQVCLARVPRCERCPLAACARRAAGRSRRCAARAASRARAASAAQRSCASSPTARAPSGGYDRDVVDSLLADGLAVRRADGLLALPEETTGTVSIPVYATNAVSCLAVQARRALPGARRRALRGGRRASLRCGARGRRRVRRLRRRARRRAPAAHPVRAARRLARRDGRALLLVHPHPRRRVRGVPQAALPPRADGGHARRLRRAHGPLDPRARDGGRLRRACASSPPRSRRG